MILILPNYNNDVNIIKNKRAVTHIYFIQLKDKWELSYITFNL